MYVKCLKIIDLATWLLEAMGKDNFRITLSKKELRVILFLYQYTQGFLLAGLDGTIG